MLRTLLPFVVPAVLLASLSGCGHEEAPPVLVRPAMLVHPLPSSLAVDSYTGEVHARFEPELGFRIGGKITKRMVDVGDRVKADQALAELDPQDVKLQLESNRAQVASAEANLQLVRSERDRYQTLLDRQMASRSQFDNAENLYRAGEARLKQMKAEYEVANNQAGYSVLRAPQNGVISRRLGEVGQVVSAGQTVYALAVEGEREVSINIPEQAVAGVKVGQTVNVELWSQPGQRFTGRIRELAPAADAQSRTFAARIAFTSGKTPAELGQSARVFIAADGHVPLSVPLAALTAENGATYVWRLDPATSTVKRTPVTVGPYGENRVPVLTGLAPEDWVVAAGGYLLHEDEQVRPIDRDNRPIVLAAAAAQPVKE